MKHSKKEMATRLYLATINKLANDAIDNPDQDLHELQNLSDEQALAIMHASVEFENAHGEASSAYDELIREGDLDEEFLQCLLHCSELSHVFNTDNYNYFSDEKVTVRMSSRQACILNSIFSGLTKKEADYARSYNAFKIEDDILSEMHDIRSEGLLH